MRKVNLTRQEKAIEENLLKGEYLNVNEKEFGIAAQAIAARKKDAILNIRINSKDLKSIRQKAEKFGIRYQTFVSEILHRVAQAH